MRDVRAFLRAVLVGGLVGAVPFLWLTIWLATYPPSPQAGVGWSGLAEAIWFALLPLIVSCAIVLTASFVIGLPLTWFVRRRGYVSGSIYIASGAWAGFTIPILLLFFAGASDGYWFAFLGAFSGAATGASWMRSMRRIQPLHATREDTKSPLPLWERVG